MKSFTSLFVVSAIFGLQFACADVRFPLVGKVDRPTLAAIPTHGLYPYATQGRANVFDSELHVRNSKGEDVLVCIQPRVHAYGDDFGAIANAPHVVVPASVHVNYNDRRRETTFLYRTYALPILAIEFNVASTNFTRTVFSGRHDGFCWSKRRRKGYVIDARHRIRWVEEEGSVSEYFAHLNQFGNLLCREQIVEDGDSPLSFDEGNPLSFHLLALDAVFLAEPGENYAVSIESTGSRGRLSDARLKAFNPQKHPVIRRVYSYDASAGNFARMPVPVAFTRDDGFYPLVGSVEKPSVALVAVNPIFDRLPPQNMLSPNGYGAPKPRDFAVCEADEKYVSLVLAGRSEVADPRLIPKGIPVRKYRIPSPLIPTPASVVVEHDAKTDKTILKCPVDTMLIRAITLNITDKVFERACRVLFLKDDVWVEVLRQTLTQDKTTIETSRMICDKMSVVDLAAHFRMVKPPLRIEIDNAGSGPLTFAKDSVSYGMLAVDCSFFAEPGKSYTLILGDRFEFNEATFENYRNSPCHKDPYRDEEPPRFSYTPKK